MLISHKLVEVFKHTIRVEYIQQLCVQCLSERENKYFIFSAVFFLETSPISHVVLSFFFIFFFPLIGLSLLTWHCPSRHWTSSHGSHLPNHHIHPLQKCQADKVSNFMPALTFHFYLSDMLSTLCVVVPVLFTQLFVKLQTLNNIQRDFIQSFCLWRLFLRRKGKCGP